MKTVSITIRFYPEERKFLAEYIRLCPSVFLPPAEEIDMTGIANALVDSDTLSFRPETIEKLKDFLQNHYDHDNETPANMKLQEELFNELKAIVSPDAHDCNNCERLDLPF